MLLLLSNIVNSLCTWMQDQDLAHKLCNKGHGLLLLVHKVLHTLLHKLAPNIFDEPLLMPMAMGTKVMPYRAVIAAWYRDAIVLFGVVLVGIMCCLRSW